MSHGSVAQALLLALALSCSSAGAPPTDPEAATRASQELDVLEAVFRYQFEHNAAGPVAQDFLFLEYPKDQDPPAQLLTRFAGHRPPVEPVSESEPREGWLGIRHKKHGGQGLIFRIEQIRWSSAETVEVEGGYYQNNRSASGNTYRAELREGKWTVVANTKHWIS